MKNINKKELLTKFISNKDILSNILRENRKVFDYIIKDSKSWKTWIELMEILISDFIEETFFFEDIIKSNEELLKIVKNYDLSEYIDWKIDIYDEDLSSSYIYFQDFADENEKYFNITKIMNQAQFDWYSEIYEEIKTEFIKFLEWLKK